MNYFSKSSIYPNSWLKRYFQIVSGIAKCAVFGFSKAHQYDGIVFSVPRFIDTMLGLVTAKFRGAIIIVDQTELFSAGSNKWLHRLEERILSKYVDQLFVISQTLASFYRDKFNKQATVLPPVVDLERFQLNSSLSYTVGYLGSFGAKDGVGLIIEAFNKASSQSSLDLRLLLIGSPQNSREYQRRIDKSDWSEQISLVLYPRISQINELLPTCDSLIMNRTGSNYASYGYPTKLGEYFACKRPVIMSNGPGFSKEFTDKVEAIKYKVDDIQALSNAIVWRYENLLESDKIAQLGYDYARNHFSAKKVSTIFYETITREIPE